MQLVPLYVSSGYSMRIETPQSGPPWVPEYTTSFAASVVCIKLSPHSVLIPSSSRFCVQSRRGSRSKRFRRIQIRYDRSLTVFQGFSSKFCSQRWYGRFSSIFDSAAVCVCRRSNAAEDGYDRARSVQCRCDSLANRSSRTRLAYICARIATLLASAKEES